MDTADSRQSRKSRADLNPIVKSQLSMLSYIAYYISPFGQSVDQNSKSAVPKNKTVTILATSERTFLQLGIVLTVNGAYMPQAVKVIVLDWSREHH